MILSVQKDLLKFKNTVQCVLANRNIPFKRCSCAISAITMSVVPQGAFAVYKVRKNEKASKNYEKYFHDFKMELSANKYSDIYMNSVWGMYNRYSCHNLKKIMDDVFVSFTVGERSHGSSSQTSLDSPKEKKTTNNSKPMSSSLKFNGFFPFMHNM